MTRSHHENSPGRQRERRSGDAAAPPRRRAPTRRAGDSGRGGRCGGRPKGNPAGRGRLLGIAALAALLYGWNITKAGYALLYSTGVQYMSHSWKGLLYGALNSHQTLDKLAGSFLPQALSARIFGFHAWSLALPQVIEGVICVLVMYRLVRRWAGAVPGLLAAGSSR